MRLSWAALLAVAMPVGCVKFDYEEDKFACTSDADCDADAGYVCAGFARDGSDVKPYCVTGKDREIAVSLTAGSPFSFEDSQMHDPCEVVDGTEVVWERWFLARDGDVVEPNEPSATLDDDVVCTGDPDGHGAGTITCTLPYDGALKNAGIALVLKDGDSGAIVSVAFAEAKLKKNTFIYELGPVSAFDLDINEPSSDPDLDGSERCLARASLRHALCGGGPALTACVSTGATDPCPAGYYAAPDTECWQTHDCKAGEDCTPELAMSCASEICTAGECD